MTRDDRDDLFADHRPPMERFRFDENVARVFPDMVRRSVPGYDQLIELIGLFSRQFVRPDTRVYDLGCSLGAVTGALLNNLPDTAFEVVAVDNALAMIQGLQHRLARAPGMERVHPLCGDIEQVAIEDASLIVLNLTLQFVAPERRGDLLRRIHAGLLPGGVLLLAEKIRLPDAGMQTLFTAVHEDFKRGNGYSEMEISRKRSALEQVLVPDTLEVHRERLADASFRHVETWFQCLGFVGLAAFV